MSNSRKRQIQPNIKQEPGVGVVLKTTPEPNSPGRLSSFKLPRDLTLGGQSSRKVPKKLYTPNLNAIRVKKNDAPSLQDSHRGRGRGRGRGGRDHNGRGRGRGRQNANLVQSGGIFSEGSAAALRRSSSTSSSSVRDDSTNIMQKPTLNLKAELKVDKDQEKEHLKVLLGDCEDTYDDLFLSKESIPTVLPIADRKRIFKIKEEPVADFPALSKIHVKQEPKSEDNGVVVKTEVMDDRPDESIPELGINCDIKVKQEFEETNNLNSMAELLSKSKSIFLLQLPDTLPGQGPDTSAQKQSATTNKEQINNPTDEGTSYCTLRELEEGRIGKIIMYKSGKAKLILGDTIFDLGIGTQSTFLQEVMSLNINTMQRSGEMINLGPVEAKLIASPDWNLMTYKQT